MAIARMALFPEGTEQHHYAVVDALGDAHVAPNGRILFAAGPTPAGWQILQIWQSQELLEAWVTADLGPAFARVGNRGYPKPPQITDWELTEVTLD